MNGRYIIIGFAALAVIFIVVGFFISRMNGDEPRIVSGPSAAEEQLNEQQNAGREFAGAPEGDTFLLATPGVSVRVKNFYRTAVRVVEGVEVVLVETSEYRVSYIRPSSAFLLNVWGERPGQARLEAERALLRALDVPEATACRLTVEVWLSPTAGTPDAAQALPLNFCKS